MDLREKIKHNYLYLFLAVIQILGTIGTKAQSIISKEPVKMPTYPYSDPNPVPEIGKIYPYFRFDGFTDTSVVRSWKMVVMENEYIKLWITPEIGGKIWGAVEKSTGKEFVYYNHAVKFRDVAMRGPWTSGGIEMNFGAIGHAPTCSSSVDYDVRTNEDGSTSCFVGAIDLASRTRWSVEVNLPKDKAYFTTRSVWDNPTLQEQSYYHWTNLGIKTAGNLEYVFPGNYMIGHDGGYSPWPEDREGHQLSFYEKNNFGSYKANHIFGELTNFYGAFWHNDNFGFGHYSPYDEKPGKKIWIWGLSDEGMIWEKLLTDKDGQYTEIQSGRLFNQAVEESSRTPFKHRGFLPGTTDEWKEYWFPVKGTSGLKTALPSGSVNLEQDGNQYKVYFCPNEQTGGKLEVRDGDKIIYTKNINLLPMEPVTGTFKYSGNSEKISVWMNNELLYDANREKYRIKRPLETPSSFNGETAYGHYLKGKEFERQRLYQASGNEYQKSLNIEPCFVPSLTGIAAISYRETDYKHSLDYALKSLSVDTYDAEGNMFYGLSSLALGDTVSAIDGFSIAAASISLRSAAYNALASVFLCKMDYAKAFDYVCKSLDYNQKGSETFQLKILCLRKLGRQKEAEKELEKMEETDPLNHFIRFERYMTVPSLENREEVTCKITNELAHETYLEYALWYYKNGQKGDALKILNIYPSSQPVVLLWQAYLSHLNGEEALANILLQKVLGQSPAKVFPFRRETLQALEWAKKESDDWKLNYYEGLIDLHLGAREKGLELWKACGNTPDFYPFYIARSKLWEKGDPRAEEDVNRALGIGGEFWRTELYASEFYLDKGNSPRAEELARKGYREHPDNYYIGLCYAKILDQANKYPLCINLLQKLVILPNEGATQGRQIWRDANIGQSLYLFFLNKYSEALRMIDEARQWPENLGVGRPYVVDERLEDFIALQCYKKLGNANSAKLMQQNVMNFEAEDNLSSGINDFLSALVLKETGNEKRGDLRIKELEKSNLSPEVIRWCQAVYAGNKKEAGEMMTGPVSGNREFKLLRELISEI
ncbi:MAG: DUF5107 domain-containing protein [Mangrovibacterium sp.]